MRKLLAMHALFALALAAALAVPQAATADAPPDRAAGADAPAPAVDPGRTALAAGAAMPSHLLTTVGVLAFACSGEVIRARCGARIEGDDGSIAATWVLLAAIPPLASGLVVWAIGDDEAAPASLPWILAGGAAGQLVGFGLAQATESEAIALLSITAFPVAGELAGLFATRSPVQPASPPPAPAAPPAAAHARPALVVPLASVRF